MGETWSDWLYKFFVRSILNQNGKILKLAINLHSNHNKMKAACITITDKKKGNVLCPIDKKREK